MNDSDGIIVFNDGSILVPEDVRSGSFGSGLTRGRIEAAFAGFRQEDVQTVPAIGGAGPVTHVWAAEAGSALPAGWRAVTLRSLIASEGDGASALLRAWHLVQWKAEAVYCGRCGARNGDAPAPELARLCPACGRLEYPRISPAVIVLIHKGERILLAHNKAFPAPVHSLVAGFVEAGESLESAVHREVLEETGIHLGCLRYIASQSWPFPNSLMLAFEADYLSGTIQVDGVEIEHADWYHRRDLEAAAGDITSAGIALPGAGSIASVVIEQWRKGK
jgi:NAD+ diphosphatase